MEKVAIGGLIWVFNVFALQCDGWPMERTWETTHTTIEKEKVEKMDMVDAQSCQIFNRAIVA